MAARAFGFMALLSTIVLLGCTGLNKDAMQHAEMKSSTRARVRLDTVWRVQQMEADTTFGIMKDAVLVGGQVVAIDASTQRLAVISETTGVVRELVGRKGRGPSEFQQIQGLGIWRDSLLLVRDPGNARMIAVHPRTARIGISVVSGLAAVTANSTCSFSTGELLIAGIGTAVLTLLDSAGREVWKIQKAWPEHREVGAERSQSLAGDGITCIAVSAFGPGMVEYNTRGEIRRARLREDFGRPVERAIRGGTVLEGRTHSASSVCLLHAHLLVLRDHIEGDTQLIDVYQKGDLKYVGSFENVEPVFGMHCDSNRVLLRTYNDGLFGLTLLRVSIG